MTRGLALFDFDGTITSKDSLLAFIRFAIGPVKYALTMVAFMPVILHYIYLKKNGAKAKQMLLSYLFKGRTRSNLLDTGAKFSSLVLPGLIRPEALEKLQIHQARQDRIVVISASLDLWLKPWCDEHGVELICTELAYMDGRFTGSFDKPNCNGQEKVARIRQYLNPEDYSPVFAYGNSRGDLDMLSLANHRYYKDFNSEME